MWKSEADTWRPCRCLFWGSAIILLLRPLAGCVELSTTPPIVDCLCSRALEHAADFKHAKQKGVCQRHLRKYCVVIWARKLRSRPPALYPAVGSCGENTELKRFPFKAWSRSKYNDTCHAYCQGFLPCLFLPFRSIRPHFVQNLSRFFLCLLWLTHGSLLARRIK